MKDIISKTFIIKDKKILKLLDITVHLSFAFCLLGILLTTLNYTYFISFDVLKISMITFRTGLFIGVFSFISAHIINKFKEDNY